MIYYGDIMKIFTLKSTSSRSKPASKPPSAVGFVESFAFGGEAPKKQSGGEGIAVGEPEAPWALPYAVGTSDLAKTCEGGFH